VLPIFILKTSFAEEIQLFTAVRIRDEK